MHDQQPTQLTPSWVAYLTGGILHPELNSAHDFHWDSRQLKPGMAFFALPGAKVHGREFSQTALQNGAAFVLTDQAHPGAVQVERPEVALLALGRAWRERFLGTVLAVGGSSGKTTTKECLAQALAWPAPHGNLNNAPGLARFFWNLDPSAPGAVVELGIDRLLEMAELSYMARPDLAVMTSIGVEHLDGLGSLENVLREEEWLLRVSPLRLASVQAAKQLSLPGVKSYGLEVGDFQGRAVEFEGQHSQFKYASHTVRLPYPGLGPVMGAIATLAACELLGQPLEPAIERLTRLSLPPGRMEHLELGGVRIINDAYNSNPLSFRAGMEYLKTQSGRKWLVLGRMAELGREATEHHLEAARLAAVVSPNLIFVGEFAEAQAQEAGGQAVLNLDEALLALKQGVKTGDLVYLKASRSVGMEQLLQRFKEGL